MNLFEKVLSGVLGALFSGGYAHIDEDLRVTKQPLILLLWNCLKVFMSTLLVSMFSCMLPYFYLL